MKKALKKLIASACMLAILASSTLAFAAGYEVVLETDITYETNSYTRIEGDNGEELYVDVTEISNLISNFSNGFSIVYENCFEEEYEIFAYFTTVESSYVIDQMGNKVDIGDYDRVGTEVLSGRITHFNEHSASGVDMYGGVSVSKDEKYGYVGLKDGVIIPCEHEGEIIRYDENVFGVFPDFYLGEAEYFVDATGKKLLSDIDLTPIKKDKGTFNPFLKYLGNNVFAYCYDSILQENASPSLKYQYLDINGNEIKDYTPKLDELQIPYDFDADALKNYYSHEYLHIEGYSNEGHSGIFADKDENGKYGLLDKNANVIVPHVYDDISGLQDGYCWVAKNGKWSLLKISTNEIGIQLNGKTLEFDQIPLVINGRTLAPVRAIFEALGATVEWKNDTREVISTKGDTTITMAIDSTTMYKNGTPITLDVAPQIISERTLVPVRAIAEAFNCKVEWNNDTQTVIITE